MVKGYKLMIEFGIKGGGYAGCCLADQEGLRV
jgi:hypothetical protein